MMSEFIQQLIPEQKFDIIFSLINKIPIYDDATVNLV